MRSAHKRGADRGSYGSKRGRPKPKSRGRRSIALAVAAVMEGDKAARKKLQALNKKHGAKHQAAQREWLAKKIPALKKARQHMDFPDYNRLLDQILKELDRAYDEGYDAAPRGGGSSGGSGRDDTWSGVPAGSFIVTPYSGPPAPGPSGLS